MIPRHTCCTFFSFNIFTIQRICIYVLTLGQNSREYGVPNEINDDDDDSVVIMMQFLVHLDGNNEDHRIYLGSKSI